MLSTRFRLRSLALVAIAAAGVTAAGASAVSSAVSSNWSGYVVAGVDTASGAAKSFTSVSGTWVQPAADCSSSPGTAASAFWVGLGGNSETSQALEQTGTEVDCRADGAARYSAWYELVPAPSVKVSLKVGAGDKMFGSVKVNGTKVTVQLKNLTRKVSFSKTVTTATPDLSSAEWIAESPSACTSYGRCRALSLTNFGTVKFSSARATTSDGHTGTISDSAWTATAIQLDSQSGDPFGRFGTQISATQALPSALSTDGSAFSVTWSASTPSNPSAGGGYPGFGEPGPFGPGF